MSPNNVPTGQIEFVAWHQPMLPSGDYVLTVQQQLEYQGPKSGGGTQPTWGWGSDQWTAAPSATLRVSVAGARFALDPKMIQSLFPPPKTLGEYYAVLPHVIFNRSTIAWERSYDDQAASSQTNPVPWLALLLFDKTLDPAPQVTSLTVQDLLTDYGASATPTGKPEFVRMLAQTDPAAPAADEIKLEVGQMPGDRLSVIDVDKSLLWKIMPSAADLVLQAHVRLGASSDQSQAQAEYPVVFCNRLPRPNSSSVMHLVSLERRKPLLDALNTASSPAAGEEVRLVSLASWEFTTLDHSKTFTVWLREAWCPDAERDDPPQAGSQAPSTCDAGVVHTLRMPLNTNADAERFLCQGYVAMHHQGRQGNHMVSWYRGPLIPGGYATAPSPELPALVSDQLVRYHSDVGMFDASYAAAWELGRLLTLKSKAAVSLYNWKRAHARALAQDQQQVAHLPFAPQRVDELPLPDDVSAWFHDLMLLRPLPFHYLVAREEMLPAGSIRFFQLDVAWLECLLDGAFSIGRATSADLRRDRSTRQTAVPAPPIYSGFLLRSPVVAGWPHLQVNGYSVPVPPADAAQYIPTQGECALLRKDTLGKDVLICIFEGNVQAVDIHEHAESIHFGVDVNQDPDDLSKYYKELRKTNGDLSGIDTYFTSSGIWKHNSAWSGNPSDNPRVLDMQALAGVEGLGNSAELGVAMIEGVEKVRFLIQS